MALLDWLFPFACCWFRSTAFARSLLPSSSIVISLFTLFFLALLSLVFIVFIHFVYFFLSFPSVTTSYVWVCVCAAREFTSFTFFRCATKFPYFCWCSLSFYSLSLIVKKKLIMSHVMKYLFAFFFSFFCVLSLQFHSLYFVPSTALLWNDRACNKKGAKRS